MYQVAYKRAWFSKVFTSDPVAENVFLAYCEAKPFWWQIYFGWRATYKDDTMVFWIPTKSLQELDFCIEDIHRRMDKED